MEQPKVFKRVIFSIPEDLYSEVGQIVQPICSTSFYFCLLARRQKLSLEELSIIRKMGFEIELLKEKK